MPKRWLTACLLVAGLAPAVPPPQTAQKAVTARLIPAPDGASAWLLSAEGIVTHLDLGSGALIPWSKEEAEPPRYADIALSADGRTLYALLPAADGRTTLLQALAAAAREETARWQVRGAGRFLVVTTDGARACVVGVKPGAGGPRAARAAAGGKTDDDDWTMVVVDLATGTQSAPVALNMRPLAVALMETPGEPAKILLAANDRVATYTLGPLHMSWHYKSPGENHAVAVVEGSPVVCLLRGGSLAVIDPRRRPVEQGRVQLTDDDATSVTELPARGRALAVSRDGRLAAVLHDDASALTLVALETGKVMKTDPLPAPRDIMARTFLGGGDAPLLALASSSGASPAVMTRAVEVPPPTPPVPEPPPVVAEQVPPPELAPQPPVEPAPDRAPEQKPETPPAPPETPEQKKPAEEKPFELKVIVPKPPGSDRKLPELLPPPQPAPPPPKEPEPVLPERTASGGTLSGHLTGAIAPAPGGLFVLLYGPNNLLKLHARVPVAADGAFSIALPPPGSYRVVVSAGSAAHVFTHPELRTVRVNDGDTGLEGVDFEVRGTIK